MNWTFPKGIFDSLQDNELMNGTVCRKGSLPLDNLLLTKFP